jgi:hypothetical protein
MAAIANLFIKAGRTPTITLKHLSGRNARAV